MQVNNPTVKCNFPTDHSKATNLSAGMWLPTPTKSQSAYA